ncbi:MAG: hypothetical protein AB7G52_02915 [Arcobacter sp.]
MYTIEKYVKNTLIFNNSLVIKLLDKALAMNKGMIKNYGIPIPTDKREWKYFMNISGKKHFTNSDVKVNVIELNTKESLSLELLEMYPYTKKELLKNESFYNELVNEFPNDILFIKGCLYPVDIEEAISAKDGTILNYNINFVEENEYKLIEELELYIMNFLQRWHVNSYTLTDELYLPAMLSMLYSSLPNKVMNIRLDKIYTNEVHSFHLEHFFRSNMDIWEDIQVLKKNTIYWLYKNLKYLMKHIGKEETFKIILNKIFEENNIGIGEYLLRVPNSVLVNELDLTNSSFNKRDVLAMTSPLNNRYILDKDNELPIETLVNLELSTLDQLSVESIKDKNTYIINNVNKKLEFLTMDKQKTKVLDINTNKLFKRNGLDLFKVILDHWIYLVKNNQYESLVAYIDPNTGGNSNIDNDKIEPIINFIEPNSNQNFTVTPRVGLLMLIKIMLKITGNESKKLTKINYDTVLTSDATRIDYICSKLYQDGYTSKLLPIIKDKYPSNLYYIKDPEEFSVYITEIIYYYTYIWTLDSNSENAIVSANIKQLFSNLLERDSYILTEIEDGLTIDELLATEDVVYDITNNFDLELSIMGIIKTFTNITVDEYDTIKDIMKSFTNILNKLTSYTTQVVSAIDDESVISLFYNNTNNIRTKNGLISILESILTPLELNKLRIQAIANDFRDRILTFDIEEVNTLLATCNKPIAGQIEIYPNTNIISTKPLTSVNLNNSFIYDIKECEFIDIFLLGLEGYFIPIEDKLIRYNSVGIDVTEEPKVFTDNIVSNNLAILKEPIDGVMYDYNEFLLYPHNKIELKSTLTYDILDQEYIDIFLLGINAEIVNIINNNTLRYSTLYIENTNEIETNNVDKDTYVSEVDVTTSGIVEIKEQNNDIVVDIPEPIITAEIK